MKQPAYFNRFFIELPIDCVKDCSHQGACDEDVEYWANKLEKPDFITSEMIRDELSECGAWDNEELANDEMNWQRLIWIAACNIKEELNER